MELLERDEVLARLAAALRAAAEGAGRLVFVAGEAGVGKTALVGRFARSLAAADGPAGGVRRLWGACEPLATPRPLGPVHDFAADLGAAAREALGRGAPTEVLFPALLDDLRAGSRPTLVLFEDVHWADEATLDLLRYLGRRLERAAGLLLIATYRDDEVTGRHPLRLVLGDLATSGAERIALAPLSVSAVGRLAAAAGLPAARAGDLHRVTGGNPFFVTEVLASGGERVPATVRDAVLARAGRLSAGARGLLEAAAVVPGRVEAPLLEAAAGGDLAGLDECLESGVLREDGAAFAFRHELARRACEAALAPARRLEVHRRILRHLLAHGAGPARLVHHAAAAGEGETVLRFAADAVREAAAVGAHREAAAHYRLALEWADGLGEAERARLREGLSYQCYLTDQVEEAIAARRQATEAWARLGDDLRHGDGLRWLSRLSWFLGRKADAERYADEAVRRLERGGETRELAMAYSNRAQLHMLAEERDAAVAWGERAVAIARRLDDAETLCHALNNVGTARSQAGESDGRALLEESLRLALERRFDEHAARAYTNLGATAVDGKDYAHAERVLDEGIEYTTARDLDSWRFYMLSWRARCHLERGRWPEAAADAERVLDQAGSPPITRITALAVLGAVRARRGEAGAGEALDEARALAAPTGELQRIGPVALARAEHAWLEGRAEEAADEAEAAWEMARAAGNPWLAGALAAALVRAGRRLADPGEVAAPWARQLAGEWRQAAARWRSLGCPWEAALALLDGGDEPAVRQALGLFVELGARPAEQIARQRLRELGARSIPRGPYREARANAAGLTGRQVEVVRQMARGLSNREIAERLHISPKTAEHHVSAVLGKLDAGSRREAVAAAERLGLLADP